MKKIHPQLGDISNVTEIVIVDPDPITHKHVMESARLQQLNDVARNEAAKEMDKRQLEMFDDYTKHHAKHQERLLFSKTPAETAAIKADMNNHPWLKKEWKKPVVSKIQHSSE